MNADALLEGEYIKAVELDGTKLPTNPTYTITSIEIESLPNLKKPGKEINKGVVSFREIERGWVMNRTNVECLKALFGPETQGWVGKRVTLGVEPTKTGPGIRIVGSPDIEREVIAEWTPPRQRKVTKRLVPTGRAGTKQPTQQPATQQQSPANVLDGFLTACRDRLGLDAADVRAWAAAVGLDLGAMDRAQLGEVFTTLQPGGTRRASYDEFNSAPPQDDAPPPGDES